MSQPRDSSPVYYREIQKNAYLKRVPEEAGGSKLKPLVLKKPPLKPLWTVLCIHNGRAPYLEQYRDAVTARAHRPIWRHSLSSARHVTASVTAKGEEFDFLVDTDDGPVRMLAPDWESMQDWVTTLRSKLVELRIVPPTENVYCAPRAPPAPRAAARDPTSPLPPTPHAPPQRVPGIDLTPITRPPPVPETNETEPETLSLPTTAPETPSEPEQTDRNNVGRTDVNTSYSSVNKTNADLTNVRTNAERLNVNRTNADINSTNAERTNVDLSSTNAERTNVDLSSTNADRTNVDISSWDNNFSSLPSTSQSNQLKTKKVAKICGQNICLDDSIFKRISDGSDDDFCGSDSDGNYRQTVLVSDGKDEEIAGDRSTNITVIQVSNKAPHTAIPIINSDTNIFNFELKDQTFINVINTESTDTNQYGTVFDGDYGHLSLTTTVSLTGPVKGDDSVRNGDNYVRTGDNCVKTEDNRVKTEDNLVRTGDNRVKSGDNRVKTGDNRVRTGDRVKTGDNLVKTGDNRVKTEEGLYERLCMASTDVNSSPLSVRRLINQEKVRKSSLPNLESSNPNSTYEYLFLGQNYEDSANVTANLNNTPISLNNIPISTNNTPISIDNTPISTNIQTISTSVTNLTANNSNITSKLSNITNIITRTSNSAARTNNAPRTTNNTPISTNNTPISSNNTPISSNNTPISSNNTLISTNNTPISTNNTLISSNNTPISTNNTPISSNNTPISTNNTPISTNITPISSNNTPNVVQNSTEQSRVHINALALDNRLRSNVERSHSQNAYDSLPRRQMNPNENIVSNGRLEKEMPKPIWKRGLTELSLLTRLRGIGQGKRQESPTRNNENDRNGVTSPMKVVHRSRPEVRADGRRRSSSLSNGQSPPSNPPLQPLRSRQAALLRNEQRRGTALVATVRTMDPPVFVDYNKQVWVSYWGSCRSNVRVGDRVAGVAGIAPKNAQHAKQLITKTGRSHVDVLFHRVPLAKIYIVNKKDQETLGIKLDSECNITHVTVDSPACRAGIPPVGKWAVTEVNNRPVNLVKGGEDDMNRLSYHGNEASILVQPSALVKKLRAGVKGHKTLLGLR